MNIFAYKCRSWCVPKIVLSKNKETPELKNWDKTDLFIYVVVSFTRVLCRSEATSEVIIFFSKLLTIIMTNDATIIKTIGSFLGSGLVEARSAIEVKI